MEAPGLYFPSNGNKPSKFLRQKNFIFLQGKRPNVLTPNPEQEDLSVYKVRLCGRLVTGGNIKLFKIGMQIAKLHKFKVMESGAGTQVLCSTDPWITLYSCTQKKPTGIPIVFNGCSFHSQFYISFNMDLSLSTCSALQVTSSEEQFKSGVLNSQSDWSLQTGIGVKKYVTSISGCSML